MSERIESILVLPRAAVIKGTRIPVSAILEQLADGESWIPFCAATRTDARGYSSCIALRRHSVLHTEITAVGAA